MKKTIFFHIGTVKTGSTFIQKFCHENSEYLAANDLAYPHVTPPPLHLPRYVNSGFFWQEAAHSLARDVFKAAPQSRVLISEEGLMGNPALMELPIFDGFEKKVILYLRPPVDLVVAWAAEKCKPYNAAIQLVNDQRGIFSFEQALNRMFHDYILCMDRVKSVLEKMDAQNVIVRPFERSQFKHGSLLHDFLGTLGITLPVFEAAPFNKSPTRKYCDVAHMAWKCLDGLGIPEFYNYNLVEAVHNNCQSGDDRPILATLPDRTFSIIADRLRPIEEYFSTKYLQGRPLFERRVPSVYGQERTPYTPPDPIEVERLVKVRVNGSLS